MARICEFAGTVELHGLMPYNYKGKTLEFHPDELCPDCRTPGLWIEDEDDNAPEPYIVCWYHDPTCPSVRCADDEYLHRVFKPVHAAESAIYHFLCEHPGTRTAREIRDATPGYNGLRTQAMHRLIERGAVIRCGKSRYRLTPEKGSDDGRNSTP